VINPDTVNRICNEILSEIEIREAKLLNWGFYRSISQSLDWLEDEIPIIMNRLDQQVENVNEYIPIVNTESVKKNLIERKLIFDNGQGLFRSRFGETVRLLYLLRQRFSDEDWDDGARLISDIKILLRRRQYPKWNVNVSEVIDNTHFSPIQKDSIFLLTEGEKLARFQADAIIRISESLEKNVDHGIVVGAGTGSGKTKAFYIPTLLHIVQTRQKNPGVSAIALYPRTELLQDQLREIFIQARKLDDLLKSSSQSNIRIGAYFGNVPRTARDIVQRKRFDLNWRRSREDNGWVCPYLICPNCNKGSLVWNDVNINKEINNNLGQIGKFEILECSACGYSINGDILPLTRVHLLKNPPDILFTTTETLNRRLSDPSEKHLFGIGVKNPPRLLLMDEIHLNEGFHGAQVAYLLRRWRFARGNQTGLCVVGLSATISQPESFFRKLTGLQNITYISPTTNDLLEEGLEYNLVVKGEISSGATLLSTTVRTLMLIGRILDPLRTSTSISGGAFGQRIFAFSDKLDSINRLHHILKEVENPVQPYAIFQYLDPKKDKSEWISRTESGQNWWIANHIKNGSLSTSLLIDITSSQYRGVNPNAEIIIASSTLEVGYNDTKVGAIIQHKAPHSQASFLQRKGRAGRTRLMRPWTVVMTSSFGRDRLMFQHPEFYFEPTLSPIELPIENYYVRKIQAALSLLDWFSLELEKKNCTTSLWTLLGSESNYQKSEDLKNERVFLVQIIINLLKNKATQQEVSNFIKKSLDISDDHIMRLIFWGPPRSIMVDILPTLLRQLRWNWQKEIIDENNNWIPLPWTDNISSYPIPEFIPHTLFSELNVPEVVIKIPERPTFKDEKPAIRGIENLGLISGMMEFTPGKVNKRFAHKDKISEAHWISIPQEEGNDIDIKSLSMEYDNTPYIIEDLDNLIYVFRPVLFNLQIVPKNIRPTSIAFHNWESLIIPQDHNSIQSRQEDLSIMNGLRIKLDNKSPLNNVFKEIIAFLHTDGQWAEVTRYTRSTNVITRYEKGFEERKEVRYHIQNNIAALGFRVEVDAIIFKIVPINFKKLLQSTDWIKVYSKLSVYFFKYKISIALSQLNKFELDWIWQIELSMILERAATLNISLERAAEIVHDKNVRSSIVASMLDLLFQIDESEKDDSFNDQERDPNYLKEKIHSFLLDTSISNCLHELSQVLWDMNDPELENWIEKVYIHSLGSAVFSTIVNMSPEIEGNDLHLDIKDGCFWISELTGGGIGLISRIISKIYENPHHFDAYFQQTITFCEREFLANQLTLLTKNIENEEFIERFKSIRISNNLHQTESLQNKLSELLSRNGISPTRSLIVAVNTRFLKPNSGKDTDELIRLIVDFWNEQQNRLGCEIDNQIIALAAARNDKIREKINSIFSRMQKGVLVDDDSQIYKLVQSILWNNCSDSCEDCIENYYLFQSTEKPSRYLLQTIVNSHEDVINYEDSNWKDLLLHELIINYRTTIKCEQNELSKIHEFLLGFLTEPIDIGYISIFPNITRIFSRGSAYFIEFSLTDLLESY